MEKNCTCNINYNFSFGAFHCGSAQLVYHVGFGCTLIGTKNLNQYEHILEQYNYPDSVIDFFPALGKIGKKRKKLNVTITESGDKIQDGYYIAANFLEEFYITRKDPWNHGQTAGIAVNKTMHINTKGKKNAERY